MKHQNGLQLLIAPTLLWLLLCGCGITFAGNEVELEETVWHLEAIESVEGEIIFTPPSAAIHWIEFSAGDSVLGQDECNTCSGAYELGSERSISFTVGCTEAACGIGYSAILNHATTYALKDGQLRISYRRGGGGEAVLVFRAGSR